MRPRAHATIFLVAPPWSHSTQAEHLYHIPTDYLCLDGSPPSTDPPPRFFRKNIFWCVSLLTFQQPYKSHVENYPRVGCWANIFLAPECHLVLVWCLAPVSVPWGAAGPDFSLPGSQVARWGGGVPRPKSRPEPAPHGFRPSTHLGRWHLQRDMSCIWGPTALSRA